MRVCFACREVIEGGSIASDGNYYHPEHFCCHRCKQPVGLSFHVYKVWRLCHRCLPRPVCGSNQCSEPDRQLGQCSGAFYRLPVDTRLTAFHGCHSVRCSVCGRGVFCCGSPGDALAYHLSDGKVTCTRCYYNIDHFDRWLRMPGEERGPPRLRDPKRPKPPFPDEFMASAGVPPKVEYIPVQPNPAQIRVPGFDDGQTASKPSTVTFEVHKAGRASRESMLASPVSDRAPRKSRSTSPGAPRKSRSGSPGAPRKSRAASPGAPRKSRAASPGAPRKSRAASPGAPRKSRAASPGAPRKSRAASPATGRAPRKSRSASPATGRAPRKSRSASPGAPRKSRAASPGAPRKSRSASPGAPRKSRAASPGAPRKSRSASSATGRAPRKSSTTRDRPQEERVHYRKQAKQGKPLANAVNKTRTPPPRSPPPAASSLRKPTPATTARKPRTPPPRPAAPPAASSSRRAKKPATAARRPSPPGKGSERRKKKGK